MIITPEERKELFRTIYKLQEGDGFIAAAQIIHPTSDETRELVSSMENIGNRLNNEAWEKIKRMTGLPEEADMPW